jgi:hypothetical protein
MKVGLIGGFVVASIMLGIYYLSKEIYLNTYTQWLILLVYLPFMWSSLQSYVVKSDINTDFRALIRAPFLTFILINLGFYLVFYLLFVYDPALLNMTAQKGILFFESELNRGTGDPQQANQLREKIEYLKQNGMQITPGALLLQMCMGAMGGFFLSALLTLMFQSRAR